MTEKTAGSITKTQQDGKYEDEFYAVVEYLKLQLLVTAYCL